VRAWGEEGPTARQWIALAGFGVVFVFYRPGADPSLLNTALLPAIAVLSAWLFTRSLMAVGLGVFMLSAAHADPGAPGVLEARVYPTLAAVGAALVLGVLTHRFRGLLARRRAERGGDGDDGGPSA
jgi:hypothetical protein